MAGSEFHKVKPNMTPYHIAKHGLLMLSKALAKEGAAFGIRSHVISPGIMEESDWESNHDIPMKRKGQPEDIFEAMAYSTKNIEFCKMIEGETPKGSCVLGIAVDKGDTSYCEVLEKTNASDKDVRAFLKENDGDIAKAILELKQ